MKLNLLIFSFFVIISCTKNKGTSTDNLSSRIGKVVVFSDSLFQYTNSIKSKFVKDTNNCKIVTVLWGDCHCCISKAIQWEKYMNDNKNDKIKYIFIIYAPNFYDFNKEIYPELPENLTFYVDTTNIFQRFNQTQFDPDLQTMLIDKHDKILAIHNPLNSDRVKIIYKEQIAKNCITCKK